MTQPTHRSGSPLTVADLIDAMEIIAPTRFAESWDNVGLIAGDPAKPISRVMLAIDYTPDVADEAGSQGCDVVIAYHPPLFQPIKRLTADGPARLSLMPCGAAWRSTRPTPRSMSRPGGPTTFWPNFLGSRMSRR